MIIKKARVQNFRSIVDSTSVELEDTVTVLVGKNEQGKTNFLRGLLSFNEQHVYRPDDLPRHIRIQLERQSAAKVPILTLWVSLSLDERKSIEDLLADKNSGSEGFRITRYFDNHYEYFTLQPDQTEAPLVFKATDITPHADELQTVSNDLTAKLQAHGKRSSSFQASVDQAVQHIGQFLKANFRDVNQLDDLYKTLHAALRGLPNQDQPIQADVESAITKIRRVLQELRATLAQDPVKRFRACLPKFVFHSTTLAQIPNSVAVGSFVENPESVSPGMANLCRAAGLSRQMIDDLAASDEASHREAYEDQYRATISGGINEFWTQAQYNVHFRIDNKQLSVSISDNTYSPRIPPRERSDGFQWYLSFFSALLNEHEDDSGKSVILLDNPGLELHADGQRDIKRFLEERLSINHQIVYVTHSPAMIDPSRIEQVRRIERLSEEAGTRVHNRVLATAEDVGQLEPLRSAVGASLVTSLVFGESNVLVEGAADKLIVEAALRAFAATDGRKFVVDAGIAESKDDFLVRFYLRSGLPLVVVLDGDSRGRELAGQCTKVGVPAKQVIDVSRAMGETGGDCELEDLVGVPLYHRAVLDTYPGKDIPQPPITTRKITKHYEQVFKETLGFSFNKRRVAETAKRLLLADDATPDRAPQLKALVALIVEAVPKVPKPT